MSLRCEQLFSSRSHNLHSSKKFKESADPKYQAIPAGLVEERSVNSGCQNVCRVYLSAAHAIDHVSTGAHGNEEHVIGQTQAQQVRVGPVNIKGNSRGRACRLLSQRYLEISAVYKSSPLLTQ